MRRRYGTDEVTGEKNILLWVAPGAVCYDREDIDFLLPWLFLMRAGDYPSKPSGVYVEGKRAGISSRAFYEAACQVAAEIDTRLARTGLDHYLVEDYYCRGREEGQIALENALDVREVRRRLRSAVSYIASGPCPRWLSCVDCSKYQRCRQKKRAGITYREWKADRGPRSKTTQCGKTT